MPISLEAGIRKFFCGPESFTPDLLPVVGEAPELRNYFVAAGLNSIGILTGGGIGRLIAHWIVDGEPDVDVTGFNIDRLHRYQLNPEYRAQRTVESLGTRLPVPLPGPVDADGPRRQASRRSITGWPSSGAYFRDVSGWEGADWFAGAGRRPEPSR